MPLAKLCSVCLCLLIACFAPVRHAVWAGASRVQPGSGTVVRIEDRGTAPVPVSVRVETSSGTVIDREIPVDRWLAGATSVEIRIPAAAGTVTRVVVDPEGALPDADRGNNTWGR